MGWPIVDEAKNGVIKTEFSQSLLPQLASFSYLLNSKPHTKGSREFTFLFPFKILMILIINYIKI